MLVSLLCHALVLSLQFGMPGLALQGARSAIDITLAQVLPPVPQPQAKPVAPVPVPPSRPRVIKKDKPRKATAPRISTPLPQPEADAPVRVIAQASSPDSEFIVPLPQPDEAVQKTIDPAEAQHGSDDVAEAIQEEAPLPELEQPLLAHSDVPEEQLRKAADEERKAAAAVREQDVLAQQRIAQESAERQKAEELLAQQRRDAELAERQRMEELAARERETVLARAAPPGDPFGAADGQGGSARTRGAAGNHGSELANRLRELSKGLDLLTGAPPARPLPADARQERRVVADSADRDVPLRMYVESWRQKIERNGSMNFPTLIGARARIDPLVSVAVRSDGSIEDVTIVRSSGRRDTDDAVRRIVRINALYSKFPPNIASRYDVIEIRRIWTFDQVLKLIEEVR